MKKFHFFLVFLFFTTYGVKAQKSVLDLGSGRSLEIGGWVSTQFILDSRATEDAVDGLFSLYPKNVLYDSFGNDINASPSIAMSSATTRFTTTFNGPNVGNATSQAYVEMDFTAKSNTNSFMFRQGWIKLKWPKSELLIGRAWAPMATYSMPHVMNISFGAPFFTFNRSEQLRYTYTPENLLFSITASYQGQYASFGPNGRSIEYMRHAVIPELSLAAQWSDGHSKIGVVGNMKTIKPRETVTDAVGSVWTTSETLTSFSGQVFAEFKTDYMSLRLNGSYTQNLAEASMLGGYAVSYVDPLSGKEKYTPSQHLNGWMSVEFGDKLKYGFFAGYSKNLGTKENVVGDFYGRGSNIASIYRIAPKVLYKFAKFDIGSELEITKVWYGIPDNNDNFKVHDLNDVTNVRLLLSATYYF